MKSSANCSPCLLYALFSIILVIVCGGLVLNTMYCYPRATQPNVVHSHPPCQPLQKPHVQHIQNIPYTRRIMSGVPMEYTAVGYLKGDGADVIYPLFGRASPTNSNRWNYHTITDKLSSVRLPVHSTDGRDCTLDMGCDELYDGHTVTIPGFSNIFHVHVYPKTFYPC